MPATPASPPKRMTRARAKAVEEKKQPAKPVKASLQKTTASSRAKTKATEEEAKANAKQPAKKPAPASRSTATNPPKTRARQTTRATAPDEEEDDHDELGIDQDSLDQNISEAPAAASTRAKARKTANTQKPAPSTRPATRTTRTAKISTAAKPTASKKVSFQDDKENHVEEIILKRPDSKDGSNVDADVSKSSKCSKKPPTKQDPQTHGTQPSKVANQPNEPTRSEPLSPKKGYQTAALPTPSARPGSAGGDVKAADTKMSSPAKKPLVVRQIPQDEQDELQEVDVHPATATPTQTPVRSAMASPPKRPPMSVQKSLKFEPSVPRNEVEAHSTHEDNFLSQSPRKLGGLASSAVPSLQKPSNAANETSWTQSPARRPPSPLKSSARSTVPSTPGHKATSLLQSPARRPPATIQTHGFGSSRKTHGVDGATQPSTASRLQQRPQKFVMPPTKNPFASPARLAAAAESKNLSATTESATLVASKGTDKDEQKSEPAAGETTNRESLNAGFEFESPGVQWASDAESEDELQSNDPRWDASPIRRQSAVPSGSSGPTTPKLLPSAAQEEALPMTVLAERFGAWAGATPDTNVVKHRADAAPVFAMSGEIDDPFTEQKQPYSDKASPVQAESFGEAMEVHEDSDQDELMEEIPKSSEELFRTSQTSIASQEYGDENEAPAESVLSQQIVPDGPTCTPAHVFSERPSLGSHTVTKVPLKPSDEEQLPRTRTLRSKSLSGALMPLKRSDHRLSGVSNAREPQTARASRFAEDLPEKRTSLAATPKASMGSVATVATPARTPRPSLNPKLLGGAVVFVDVHTTEGADASEIFVDLLCQMGARCVKHWNWNPDSKDADSRVGITHVVFKDGGVRTMEKVKMTKGLVQCVGVGWVLDCERGNKWVDESEYAIDESTIPRGGHRRRKSMEPRMLANTNGTLSAMTSPRKLSGSLSPTTVGMSPSKEFLNLDSPEDNRRVGFAPLPLRTAPQRFEPATPGRSRDVSYDSKPVSAFGTPPDKSTNMESTADMSPTTPYFLHANQLLQQTCPPKQTQQLFFPVSGEIEEEEDISMRHKLLAARRKSLQFAPRVGSPLAQPR